MPVEFTLKFSSSEPQIGLSDKLIEKLMKMVPKEIEIINNVPRVKIENITKKIKVDNTSYEIKLSKIVEEENVPVFNFSITKL